MFEPINEWANDKNELRGRICSPGGERQTNPEQPRPTVGGVSSILADFSAEFKRFRAPTLLFM
jgi:hypothetical protein